MAIEAIAQTATNPKLYTNLAKTLPGILVRFFQKFPPGQPYAREPQRPERLQASVETSEDGAATKTIPLAPEAVAKASTPFTDPTYNPFLPWRNPVTLRWRGPYYGLRRQAMLCKAAKEHGVEELLPWSMKLSAVKLQKRIERGLRVKGTGVDQKVKGHKWERAVRGKIEIRRKAMMDMPRLVKEWKTKGHGRHMKKWPSGKAI